MSELKPCPFCGSENVGTSYKDTFSGDFRRGVYCADCCGGIYPYYGTEAEAIAAWNSRAERTCEMEPTFINPHVLANIQEFMCTACGRFAIVEQLGDDDDRPNYCPNCGCKVVDE